MGEQESGVIGFMPKQGAAASSVSPCEDGAPTLRASMEAAVYDARGNGGGDIAPCITGDHERRVSDYTAIACQLAQTSSNGLGLMSDTAFTLDQNASQAIAVDCRNHTAGEISGPLQAKESGGQSLNYINPVAVVPYDTTQITAPQNRSNPQQGDPCHCLSAQQHPPVAVYPEINGTLTARFDSSPQAGQINSIICAATGQEGAEVLEDTAPTLNCNHEQPYIARMLSFTRRLTPLECERLQGYPDNWTDIPGASDTARYKACGNSIALPFWRWMLRRLCGVLQADSEGNTPPTMGSLFDGIGGFPLIWEEINGKGTALWASEIDKFAIRVTELRFPDA